MVLTYSLNRSNYFDISNRIWRCQFQFIYFLELYCQFSIFQWVHLLNHYLTFCPTGEQSPMEEVGNTVITSGDTMLSVLGVLVGSFNGLSPVQHQAIIWTSAAILLIGPLVTNFSEISIKIYKFSFKKIHFKMLFSKMVTILSRPQCVEQLVYMFP